MRAGRVAAQAARLPGEGKEAVPAEPAKARAFLFLRRLPLKFPAR